MVLVNIQKVLVCVFCLFVMIYFLPQYMNGDRTVGLAISHASSEAQPVFRFWSPVYQKHFYTISESERDLVITNDPNWDYEGVVFDGYSDQVVDIILTGVLRVLLFIL